MPSIRVPVSLKFDSTSDLYSDFVLSLKASLELSSFIVGLLELYYSDEEVQDLINMKKAENDIYAPLRDQINRIQLQHAGTIAKTSMLANQARGAIQDLSSRGMMDGVDIQLDDSNEYTMNIGVQPESKPDNQHINPAIGQQTAQEVRGIPVQQDSLMERRMDSMETSLNTIMAMLGNLTSAQQQPSIVTPQQARTMQESGQPQYQQAPPTPEQPVSEPTIMIQPIVTPPAPQYVEQVTHQSVGGQAPVMEQQQPTMQDSAQVQQPVYVTPQMETTSIPDTTAVPPVILAPPTEQMIPSGQPQIAVQVEPILQTVATPPTPNAPSEPAAKPASFAKAFSSIKKK